MHKRWRAVQSPAPHCCQQGVKNHHLNLLFSDKCMHGRSTQQHKQMQRDVECFSRKDRRSTNTRKAIQQSLYTVLGQNLHVRICIRAVDSFIDIGGNRLSRAVITSIDLLRSAPCFGKFRQNVCEGRGLGLTVYVYYAVVFTTLFYAGENWTCQES